MDWGTWNGVDGAMYLGERSPRPIIPPEVMRGKVMSREGGEGENFGMERWAPGIWGSTMGKGLEYHGVQLPRNGGSKRYAEG